jgi:hypothetical protein
LGNLIAGRLLTPSLYHLMNDRNLGWDPTRLAGRRGKYGAFQAGSGAGFDTFWGVIADQLPVIVISNTATFHTASSSNFPTVLHRGIGDATSY